MRAFARISAEILELAEGAAKDLRLLPVGGTGTRGWDEYKDTPTSDRTGQDNSNRDSHRRVRRPPYMCRKVCVCGGPPEGGPRNAFP